MGLAERPVFETETRGRDPVSNRSQCACLLARSRLAEGGGIEPLTFAVTLVFRTSRQPSSGAFHWYPCADSNREPPRSKRGTSTRLGYRGELVRAVGFEPTLPRLSTSCLPLPIGLRAHGAAPRIRTETDPGLNRTLLPIEREPQDGRPERVLTSYLPDESRVSRPLDDGAWKPASGTIRIQRGFKGRGTHLGHRPKWKRARGSNSGSDVQSVVSCH
jgi:hypothetical protein